MKACIYELCRKGFTVVESMIAMGVSMFIIAGLLTVFIACNHYWHRTSLALSTNRKGTQCLERIVYGVGTNIGMRGAYWVTNRATSANWRLQSSNYYGEVWYVYDRTNQNVIFSNAHENCIIGRYIVDSQVSTTNGLGVSLTVRQTDGRYACSNTLSTYVKLRAPKSQ